MRIDPVSIDQIIFVHGRRKWRRRGLPSLLSFPALRGRRRRAKGGMAGITIHFAPRQISRLSRLIIWCLSAFNLLKFPWLSLHPVILLSQVPPECATVTHHQPNQKYNAENMMVNYKRRHTPHLVSPTWISRNHGLLLPSLID